MWKPSVADLEKVIELRRAKWPIERAASELGVSADDLMAFMARLEMGRDYAVVVAAERAVNHRPPPRAAERRVSIRASGFPSMMRGR